MKLLVINGPNLNMLGKRQPDIYGKKSLDDINKDLESYAKLKNIAIDFFQSNHEGKIVDKIQEVDSYFDGLIINPGALSHYSISIRDAISSINTETIEVHISNIFKREIFRHHSVISEVCKSSIVGLGLNGYKMAINKFIYQRS